MSSSARTVRQLEQPSIARTGRVLVAIFTATTFWAAMLLFLLEPMFAKMILPTFGGSPAVWNTSMVFFQLALFLAYIYSHYTANRTTAYSVFIHSFAVLVPLLVLPISIRSASNLSMVVERPAMSVLLIAATSIGLPFFTVATSGPLLQRWFSQTTHRDASDPYFLYAASNAGSLVGLALYPCFLEPEFATDRQSLIWSAGYAIFLVFTLICGLLAYRWRAPNPTPGTADIKTITSGREKLLWAALAFVPASLLYAFTAQLSTDFPPIPLLWVIPLGLYLVTFIAAFSAPMEWLRRSGKLLPSMIVAGMVIFLIGFGIRPGGWVAMGLVKLFCFVVIALGFHTELAHRRPARQQLTEYYLWISAGGILGGLLNAFIAPVVFSDFWEYPLTLLIAAALLPAISAVRPRSVNLKFLAVAIACISLVGIGMQLAGHAVGLTMRLLVLAIGAILCMRVRARWMALALLLVSVSIGRLTPRPLYQGRSFFGRYQVTTAAGGKWHILQHGTTIHGLQRVVDSPLVNPPRGYYWPVKTTFDLVLSDRPNANIAVVGLGAGMIACYSRPEQSMTFYEIDPLVERIASRYFTFLSQCMGRRKVVLGDARLTLAGAAPHSFDAIVLDAFSSDAIPIHLLTEEAFHLYREKLTADGIILVHLTNNYLELAPVVAGSGGDPGFVTLVLDDTVVAPGEVARGRLASRWALIVPSPSAPLFEAHGWKSFSSNPMTWTDRRSSLLGVVMWPRLLGFDLLKMWTKRH